MKTAWHSLTTYEQEKYLAQARFLIERGYVLDRKEENVANSIFEKATASEKV